MNIPIAATNADMHEMASARKHDRHGRVYVYTPASFVSRVKFGLGTLAVLVVPPLIPGVTGRGLIMGYIGALVAAYFVICVWGILRSMQISATHDNGRRSR
jgi:hypothetical protein